jgi:hypothetical protein
MHHLSYSQLLAFRLAGCVDIYVAGELVLLAPLEFERGNAFTFTEATSRVDTKASEST